MDIDGFYNATGLSERVAPLNRKLDKKMFYEHADLNKKDKDAISKYIERMELSFLLTAASINIQPFISEDVHYEGVMFIHCRLKEAAGGREVKAIAGIVHSAIPNPVAIIFTRGGEIQVSSCLKRLSKADRSAVVLGNANYSDWLGTGHPATGEFLDTVNLANLPFTNFYEFFKSFDRAVEAAGNAGTAGSFTIIKGESQQMLMDSITGIEAEIASLKAKIKKESQFNKKAELNVRIQRLLKEAETKRTLLKES